MALNLLASYGESIPEEVEDLFTSLGLAAAEDDDEEYGYLFDFDVAPAIDDFVGLSKCQQVAPTVVKESLDIGIQCFVASVSPAEVKILQDPNLFTPVVGRDDVEQQSLTSYGDREFETRGDLLIHLQKYDPAGLRDNVRLFGSAPEEYDGHSNFLGVCRAVRYAYPLKNRSSKRLFSFRDDSTYSKFLLDHDSGEPTVFFGCAHSHHHAWKGVRGVYSCVDTDAEDGSFFRNGNIKDWRKFVNPGDRIFSDVAYGGVHETGMTVNENLRQIYSDIVASGHELCYKGNLRERVVGRVCCFVKVRPHNNEVIWHCVGPPDEAGEELRQELLLAQDESNIQRMGHIIGGEQAVFSA